ncbi:MAG: aspartate aminotransferase family protein [Elusimicrobia bacterium]|nr:aspartate aminotransferase family protein [Elusimicrobiota bacterium]
MDYFKEEENSIFQTYRRQPLLLVKGKGSYVWDHKGKKYLDFFSGLGVNNLGHCFPSVVHAISAQAKTLMHTSNLYYTLPQIECAKELVKRTFSGKVFFSNSGAEANECAIKLARRWGQKNGDRRFEIITFQNSFHGRTMATLSLTGQEKFQKGFDPLLEKVVYAKFNDPDSVQKMVTKDTCAIFVEPVQGEGGVNPAAKSFLEFLRKVCNDHDLLLVFDEVQCGMGRSGHLFFYQYFGIEPDILTMAKALGGGLPIGCTLAKEEIALLLNKGDHASTFGGNPVVCSAAIQVLRELNQKRLDSVKEKSKILIEGLEKLKKQFPALIAEVRGMGLMLALELKIEGDQLVERAREKGLLINCTQGKVLRFLPPLIITPVEIKSALIKLEKCFKNY